MDIRNAFVDPADREQFELRNLLYATASALIPYLAAVVLVLLRGEP
jgi:hypothetical protein